MSAALRSPAVRSGDAGQASVELVAPTRDAGQAPPPVELVARTRDAGQAPPPVELVARTRDAGQASVELVALLPIVLIIGVAILTLLAARAASGQASAAAQAGAMALIQDADARSAARDALPPAARGRATIRLDGRAVTVTVRPETHVGFLADALSATATANAGPEPR